MVSNIKEILLELFNTLYYGLSINHVDQKAGGDDHDRSQLTKNMSYSC